MLLIPTLLTVFYLPLLIPLLLLNLSATIFRSTFIEIILLHLPQFQFLQLHILLVLFLHHYFISISNSSLPFCTTSSTTSCSTISINFLFKTASSSTFSCSISSISSGSSASSMTKLVSLEVFSEA